MKWWMRVFAALALAFVFVGAAVFLCRTADPVHQGRHASEWASDLLSADYQVRTKAEAALKVLGERGVPQLGVLLRRGSGPWDEALARLNTLAPSFSFGPIDAHRSRACAAEMLGLLGPKAHLAIPSLVASLAYPRTAS